MSNNTYPERHRASRDRPKARGMRQVVRWVPDTRRPGFGAEPPSALCEAIEADPFIPFAPSG